MSIALAVLSTSVCAFAHHSFSAEFDVGRPVQLTGTVAEMEWTNPHAWIHIETMDGDGNREHWAVELLGVNSLVRSGLTPRSINAGDVLTIVGFGARDGTNTANASSVTRTETGERLWTSSSERD
ncbi:MAG TPA: DUF6152 family protein [Gammaproteobacteria bacterium]|nr:DUF6152 family protein [Gammaproteobacteria bacterium]